MDRVCDDLVADVQSVEQCQAQCGVAGKRYMGMACPRANVFECWCCDDLEQNSDSRTGVIPTSECNGGELTSGVNGNRHDHCSGFSNAANGGYVLDGYYLGGHCRAAIYDLGEIAPPSPPPAPSWNAGQPSIVEGKISVASAGARNGNAGMMIWDWADQTNLDGPQAFDGDLTTPVGGDENGQHDDIVAVKLNRVCQSSSFAVYGADRSVPETDLRHIRVAGSLDGRSWRCYTQSDSGSQGGTPPFRGVGDGDTDCHEGPSHAPNGGIFNLPFAAQYVEFSFWGRTDVFEVELTSCDGTLLATTPTTTIVGGKISVADAAARNGNSGMMTWDWNERANIDTPELFDGDLASPVGGDANGQHDDIVAVKLSNVCAMSSFAVYGADRSVPETALRHIRVAYGLDGHTWTCWTQSFTGEEVDDGGGGAGSFTAGSDDCSTYGPTHAPNGAVFNIPRPAQYVEFAFCKIGESFSICRVVRLANPEVSLFQGGARASSRSS